MFIPALYDIAAVAIISILIYVPHLEPVLARVLMYDGASQNDLFLLSPGYAHLHGLTLDVDVRSFYGIGEPVILSHLAQWLGGFDYIHTAQVAVVLLIAYYVLVYFGLKILLKSSLLSLAAVLLMIDMNIFGPEGGPVLLFETYCATPIRTWFDILFFFSIYGHLKTKRPLFLLFCAALAGLQMFYIFSSGICLAMTFVVYLMLLRRIRTFLIYNALMIVIFLLLLFMVVKGNLFGHFFWNNFLEQIHLFDNGWDNGSFMTILKGDPILLLMSVFVLLLYLFSAAMGLAMVFLTGKFKKRWVFLGILGIYGLLSYQHFIIYCSFIVLFRTAVIFITLGCLWVQWFLPGYWLRRGAAIGLFLLAIILLCCNANFIDYPNILNFSSSPNIKPLVKKMVVNVSDVNFPQNAKLTFNALGQQQENIKTENDFNSDNDFINYYRHEFDFSQDAAMIRGLTAPQEKVALISSYDLPILMQADRKPFFYVFCLFTSRSMRVRALNSENFYTQDNLQRTIDQLENQKPKYVFLEKVYLNPEVIKLLKYTSYDGSYNTEYDGTLQFIRYTPIFYFIKKDG